MTDPFYLAANKTASKLEMLSKELCTNDTLNIWCEMVSKIESEQHRLKQKRRRSNGNWLEDH